MSNCSLSIPFPVYALYPAVLSAIIRNNDGNRPLLILREWQQAILQYSFCDCISGGSENPVILYVHI